MTYFRRTNQLFSGSEIRIYDCAIHVITYKFQTGFRDIRLAAVKISFIHASWTNVL